jgi:precorrin-2/cobalt-factor-2 C20-methyltransferase
MSGTLYGIGVGPGDPELLTLKALRILKAAPVVAYPAPDTGASFARSIVAAHLNPAQVEYPIIIPMRTERFPAQPVYDRAAADLDAHLATGRDVAFLCEGDPFFYGSFMYLFERLADRHRTEVVPGVSSMMAAAAALGRPLAARNDMLSVVPGPLPDAQIAAALSASDALAIIKVGRHLRRITRLIEEAGLSDCAGYLERVGLPNQVISPLKETDFDEAPYFSMILVYKGAEGWIAGRKIPVSTGPAR